MFLFFFFLTLQNSPHTLEDVSYNVSPRSVCLSLLYRLDPSQLVPKLSVNSCLCQSQTDHHPIWNGLSICQSEWTPGTAEREQLDYGG